MAELKMFSLGGTRMDAIRSEAQHRLNHWELEARLRRFSQRRDSGYTGREMQLPGK